MQRWAQIEELFHRACECDPRQRTRVLEECCNGDLELRSTVETLLASGERAAHNLQAAVNVGLDAVAFPLVGETISHYRILAGVDTGGMGSVYRAEDVRLSRQVALKFLAEEFAKDVAALGRFEREARAASALEHPNICPIYEFGEHAGQPFLVMQLLEGQTLRELISRNGHARPPFTVPELLELGLQIAAALEAAHQHGIVHRDIKPANIFITTKGQVKVLDFGLAKPPHGEIAEVESEFACDGSPEEHQRRSLGRALSTPEAFLSRTGVAIGTSAYMSPEQARGEKLDARSDIFSFGLVLYEMATGHRAFEGATEPILHDTIFRQAPAPVRQLNRALPARFEAIVGKTLERDRAARYQTAEELHADLEALRRKAMRRFSYRGGMAVVAGLALVGVAASIWLASPHAPAPALPDAKLQQVTSNSWENPVTSGALSPNGRYLAYADTGGMRIKRLGSDEWQAVPTPEGLRNEKVVWEIIASAWFPDSRQFLAVSHPLDSSISTSWVVPVSGGAPRKLRDAAIAWSVSPDGALISFGTNRGRMGERELWLMGSDGEQARKLLEVDNDRAICCMYSFTGGSHVAYVTTDGSGSTLIARGLSGGHVVTLIAPPFLDSNGDFTWLPDGRFIYSDNCGSAIVRSDTPCSIWIERFDIRSGALTERARRLTKVVGASISNLSATADGRRVAFLRSTGYGTAYVADLGVGATSIRNTRHFTLDEGDDGITDWTPDSRTAIIVRNRGDHSAVYKQALNSEVAEPIVANLDRGLLETAILSPDAKWIVLQIYPLPPPAGPGPPRKQIWRLLMGGGGLRQLFSLAPGSTISCARAPATLCVTAEPTADRKQTVVAAFDPADGVRGRELLRFDRYPNPDEDAGPLGFALSPDGRWLSTSAAPAGPVRIFSLQGGPARELSVKELNVKGPAAWTADGKGLIVTTYREDAAVLLHVDRQGNVHELFKCESAQPCFGIPSPDGSRLGIYQIRTAANIWMLDTF